MPSCAATGGNLATSGRLTSYVGVGAAAWPSAPAHAPDKPAALLEVFDVVWVVGIGGPSDFDMALDWGAGQAVEFEHAGLALGSLDPCAEHPIVPGAEVFGFSPRAVFVGMASGGPAPEFADDIIIQFGEGRFGRSVAIIVGPTAQQRVELSQERFLRVGRSGLYQSADLVSQALHFALCGSDQ